MSSGCTRMNCILSHGNSLITRPIIDAAGQRAGCRHIIYSKLYNSYFTLDKSRKNLETVGEITDT